MDYIALNHQTNNAYGVHYNSPKPIGGIRYYTPEKKPVQANPKTGETKVFLEVESPKTQLSTQVLTEPPQPKEIGSKRPEVQKITYDDVKAELQKTAGEEAWENIQEDGFKKTQELITQDNLKQELEDEEDALEDMNSNASQNYVITIQDKEVDFSKVGINRTRISRKNKRWLSKAQNYFLTVEEEGIKIGSAESFTSMEILEALWRTAEQVNVNPKRFIVQLYNESRFNPNVKGQAGERGLGQFKKGTAEHYGYSWKEMTDGIESYAYQAKAAAEFVKKVGEIAYNGGGEQAEKYHKKISHRIDKIDGWDTDCAMKTIAYCAS